MFQVDPAVPFLRATREQVVKIVESINQPVVAVPGKQAQICQAFVVSLRNPGGSYSVHVHLFLSETREAVLYSNDVRQLSQEQCHRVEEEAVHFCESMGFMLDNLNFASLPGRQQDELLRRLPPFQRDPSRVASQPGGNLMASQPGSLTPPGGVAALGSTPGPASRAASPAPGATPAQMERLARLLASF